MISEYLNYNLIYGTEKDIPDADVIYCQVFHLMQASIQINVLFLDHIFIFPDNKLRV